MKHSGNAAEILSARRHDANSNRKIYSFDSACCTAQRTGGGRQGDFMRTYSKATALGVQIRDFRGSRFYRRRGAAISPCVT
ncbi:hypothetical protein HYPDE_33823 [Hyphomicrobium denitrificans 1NES1]|uniref:Uncharacterized protein n=1 Tax=Hyphomicrobium denitrificans 1NES1 TaxID=670307 RepID=N0B874_9HYPH|nr:hypothetical protein HYPDE_33823 [Hyphomicrobium denitrificans 1NES1]